jgi:ABC-type glycerol-3-phosphate transport system substrate-binding protein
MKKTLTVLIAAGALLGAAGCSAPEDTTAETCSRIQTVGAGPTSAADKAGMIRLANRLRPIEATASGELQAPLDASAQENPDTAKLEELQGAYSAAGQKLSALCGAGGQ